MELSDADPVRRVLAGDVAAFETLVARYRDRYARYAVHMLGSREDAEEAVQDAFVRAYRSLAARAMNQVDSLAFIAQVAAEYR